MDLIPEEELKGSCSINLAPMVDFLFLVIALFAALAVSRSVLYDTEVSLIKLKTAPESLAADDQKTDFVNIAITGDGRYKWLTEVTEFSTSHPEAIKAELLKQQRVGSISKDPSKTKVLLHIDREAHWEAVAQAIFIIKEAGFPIHPIYESFEKNG